MTKLLLGCLSVALINAVSVRAEMRIDPSRVEAIAGFLPPHAAGLGQPATNRVFWNALAQRSELKPTIANASKLAQEETPALPDDLYLDFSKTGNRDRCQRVIFARNDRVTTFALAECLEDKGSFVQPLEREIEAVCRERTWVYPAHDGKLDNFRGRTVDIDLHAAYVAWNLATANRLLADKLSPATRQLIRTNIGRRVLQPFRDMIEGRRAENWWLRGKNNWSAVCHAGVAGAALALEDSSQTRAWHIAAAEKYMPFFLQSFTPDGYCSEGIGYWNYGFGNFLMLAETIRQATGNRIDLLDDPAAALPAQFGLRSETINGIYPSISDCVPGTKPDANLAGYAAKRFGRELPASPTARSAGNVDSLFSFLAFATSDEFAPANIM
ncbi:MAG TPA: hypothetical protein VK327_09825, partial [Candidatus Paceibacterota bacterium]|nr:hypothetical protein [Candidatus Paceibacterota bacterium]